LLGFEKLTGAALDGKIVKLTALVSVNLTVNLAVKLVCRHAKQMAGSCVQCSEAAVLA
jgi:hypothetical protein